jgi:hypothetical protein
MDAKRRVQSHDCCLVPYRLSDAGVEFCLVTPIAETRWTFPHIPADVSNGSVETLLEPTAASLGLRGELQGSEPLGNFVATRGNEARNTSGYLMRVTQIEDTWPNQSVQRRRWCLAEEARIRIRRKPLRRFIDLALHQLGAGLRRRSAENGHAPSGRDA